MSQYKVWYRLVNVYQTLGCELVIFNVDLGDMPNDEYVISTGTCVVYIGELADTFNYGIVGYSVTVIWV